MPSPFPCSPVNGREKKPNRKKKKPFLHIFIIEPTIYTENCQPFTPTHLLSLYESQAATERCSLEITVPKF